MGRKIKIRRKNESMGYSGSLLQQNFGESIDKGYILWDIESKTHVRKFIPNDFGFAKITIAKGEKFEERIEHIKFSSNKKKTKVYVIWEDYEENFSQEKENQIMKLVKDKHGCEIVKVQFETIIKEIVTDDKEEEIFKESEEYLREYLEQPSNNCTKEEMREIVALHRETNELLQIVEGLSAASEWSINKFEVSNLFSFPIKPTIIDFDKLGGVTGVFGKNFNGKSNVIKAIVWTAYKEILGGGDPRFITNLYTDSNKGYGKLWITIDGKKYLIDRGVKTTVQKDGGTKNTYTIKYQCLEFEYDEEGNLDNEKWENEKSDSKTAEKNEVGKLIEHAIGTFDDFTKSALQTQGGKDDYLSMSQQPKNSLISKYLGLEPYRLRYEYRKKFFNEIEKKQKELGQKVKLEEEISNLLTDKTERQGEYENAVLEKNKANESKDNTDTDILLATKKLEKVESVSISDPDRVKSLIDKNEKEVVSINKDVVELEDWLSKNFKKELPFDATVSIDQLIESISKEKKFMLKDEQELYSLETWFKDNVEKKEITVDGLEEDIDKLKIKISHLQGLLDTFKGKKCPTCSHVHEKANPHKEEECLEDIERSKSLLAFKREKISGNNDIKAHNAKFQTNESKRVLLKQSVTNRKDKIESVQSKIDLINNSQDIISHNQKVESNSVNLKSFKDRSDLLIKENEKLKENLVKIKNNDHKIKNNAEIQEHIDTLTDLSKAYKLSVFNMDKQINMLFGQIKVIESNINICTQKLIDIKEYELLFRKYSLYLQAMHRDGIPALIIRRKLPLINHRVNTILQQSVDFKVALEILANGDVVETFYFSDDKSDALPLNFSSGSQKFVSMIAIKDAFHYISSLPKPSLSIIDEGFGTLDDELTFEIMNILTYLKNKHKNVIVITHRNEIKDFADNIIDVTKVTTGISQEVLDNNPKAGVTKITVI